MSDGIRLVKVKDGLVAAPRGVEVPVRAHWRTSMRVDGERVDAPAVSFAGFWLCLVPAPLWATLEWPTKRFLSSCFTEGYHELGEIRSTPNSELLQVHGVGAETLGSFRSWEKRHKESLDGEE